MLHEIIPFFAHMSFFIQMLTVEWVKQYVNNRIGYWVIG